MLLLICIHQAVVTSLLTPTATRHPGSRDNFRAPAVLHLPAGRSQWQWEERLAQLIPG